MMLVVVSEYSNVLNLRENSRMLVVVSEYSNVLKLRENSMMLVVVSEYRDDCAIIASFVFCHSSAEDKPFSSQMDVPDVDLPQAGGALGAHAGNMSKRNSTSSLLSEGSAYAVFNKGSSNVDGGVTVVQESSEDTDMYVDVRRKK